MDYKCPSSGMEDKMLLENIRYLGKSDVLKFVVGTKQDLERALEIIRLFEPSCNIYFSPVYGKFEPKEIVNFILSHKLQNCRLQLQLHKVICQIEKEEFKNTTKQITKRAGRFRVSKPPALFEFQVSC